MLYWSLFGTHLALADACQPPQSAARSKVRKMRLIAELEAKQAILQEQVVNMTAEVQMLHGETMRIGACPSALPTVL